MKLVKDMKDDLNAVRTNPADMQRVAVDTVRAVGNGEYDVVDPSNPFTYLLEVATTGSSVGIDRAEVLLRKQYPSLAQSYDDLYHHMSDVDFSNRFATPSRVDITFLIGLDEIKRLAIDVEGRYKKITIPKDTEISVDGMPLTLNYPIDIRVMPHGGVRVVYDTEFSNPLETLMSNIISHKIIRMEPSAGTGIEGKLLKFEVPMKQFRIKTYYDQLNESSGFKKTYSFDNQFYYCRAYIASGSKDEWKEIKTTHSDQVYDPTIPTALLRVADDQLEVSIPQIYFTRGLLGKGIRLDIYTTRGEVTQSLELYQPRNFVAKWRDLSRIENPYTVPIQSIGTFTVFSTDRTRGGRNGLTFDEMRQRVISNSLGAIDIPITPAQITAALDNMGYSIVKDVDNITNRTYLATKALPAPSDSVVNTPMGCTIKTLQSSIDQLTLMTGVYDNGPRITLPSGALFKLKQGLLDVVDGNELAQLNQSTPEGKATLLQSNDYAYIPFHYVLDATDDRFDVRPYYLDKPGIMTKEFVAENETTQLEVMSFRYGVSKADDGYRLVVTTRSGSVFRSMSGDRITAQLSFTPPGEVARAYMNATYLGRQEGTDEHMFEFMLTSEFDLDQSDNLLLTSFFMYDDSPRSVASPLSNKFDITYIVDDHYVDDMETSEMDSTKASFLLENDDNIAVSRERFSIHFGEALSNLWSRARSVAGSIEYKTYQADVYETYESDIYERNDDGTLKLTQGPDGIEYTKLHSKGDIVTDGDDLPIVKHAEGSVMLDQYGEPIPKSGRKVMREVDLLLFEGGFNYVTDAAAIDYADQSTQTIVSWVVDDIIDIQDRLLENTEMWFYPKATMGDVDVVVENGIRTAVNAAQSLRVKFYMTRSGHENIPLREDLKQTAIDQISQQIGTRTVSVLEMARMIKSNVGDDVIDVVVSGLGGSDENYEMLSIQEDSESLGINKRLVVLPNNTLTVEDDISVEYVRHREN